MRFCSESGQGTIEAAVMLPVLFVVFGLFIQPTILLYDKAVMSAAASEGCRLVATSTASETAVRGYVRRRLGAVPKLNVFHVGGDEGWKVSWTGPNKRGKVTVTIVNKAQPLPLFGVVAGLGNSITKKGYVKQTVKASASSRPVWSYENGEPEGWIGAWQ